MLNSSKEIKKEIDLMFHNHTIKVQSGVFIYDSFFTSIMNYLANICRNFLNKKLKEITLPILLPKSIYKNRLSVFNSEYFEVTGGSVLATTSEETAAMLFKDKKHSGVYAVSLKLRNEKRCNSFLRTQEFIMIEGYTISNSKQEAIKMYREIKKIYAKIFTHLHIQTYSKLVKCKSMLSEKSHEILLDAPEAQLQVSKKVNVFNKIKGHPSKPMNILNGIELAHIFQLGTSYSETEGLVTSDGTGALKHMCSYGIGLNRLLYAALRERSLTKLHKSPFYTVSLNTSSSEVRKLLTPEITQKFKIKIQNMYFTDSPDDISEMVSKYLLMVKKGKLFLKDLQSQTIVYNQ